MLEPRLTFRNHANGPARIHVISIRVTIEDRFVEITDVTVHLSRVADTTVFMNKGFNKEAFESFADRTHGTVVYEIEYGHPEGKYLRRAKKSFDLDVFKHHTPATKGVPKRTSVTFNWILRAESDEDA